MPPRAITGLLREDGSLAFSFGVVAPARPRVWIDDRIRLFHRFGALRERLFPRTGGRGRGRNWRRRREVLLGTLKSGKGKGGLLRSLTFTGLWKINRGMLKARGSAAVLPANEGERSSAAPGGERGPRPERRDQGADFWLVREEGRSFERLRERLRFDLEDVLVLFSDRREEGRCRSLPRAAFPARDEGRELFFARLSRLFTIFRTLRSRALVLRCVLEMVSFNRFNVRFSFCTVWSICLSSVEFRPSDREMIREIWSVESMGRLLVRRRVLERCGKSWGRGGGGW